MLALIYAGSLAGALLAAQAALLPAESWVPYGGIALLFIGSQLGNITFFLVVVVGAQTVLQRVPPSLPDDVFEALVAGAIALFAIGLMARAASTVLWNGNWLL